MSQAGTDRVIIRQARPGDAGEAIPLIRRGIEDIASILTGSEDDGEIARDLTGFFIAETNRISYHNVFVAEVEGQVVGLVVYYHGSQAARLDAPIVAHLQQRKNTPDIRLDKEADGDELYIDTLAVHAAFGGRGIGSALIGAVEERGKAEGYDKVALLVEKDNEQAQRLYQRLGFQTDKVVQVGGHDYYHQVKRL